MGAFCSIGSGENSNDWQADLSCGPQHRLPCVRAEDKPNGVLMVTDKLGNGDDIQAYKWRNFKVRYILQDAMFDPIVRLNFPRVYDLRRDPNGKYGLVGGMGETGTENLTWVLPAVTRLILAHRKTLVEEPPIAVGTPEPYAPPK